MKSYLLTITTKNKNSFQKKKEDKQIQAEKTKASDKNVKKTFRDF